MLFRSSRDALRYASQELRGDREVVLAAVRQNGVALRYASPELKDDPGLNLTGIPFQGEPWLVLVPPQPPLDR